MEVICLIDNKAISDDLKSAHGLCLYIKTEKHNILFDVGPNEAFIYNAELLGVNLGDIDIVIISHGHYDHGGGLEAFLKINNKAKIYINKLAFNGYYSKSDFFNCYIGLDNKLKSSSQFVFINDDFQIDNELLLFSNINNDFSMHKGYLYKKEKNNYLLDDFLHEQNLIIFEKEKYVLITGCAHNGIINIVNTGTQLIGKNFDFVYGGFHLKSPFSRGLIDENMIVKIGNILNKNNTVFFAMHCTGDKPFNILKTVMNGKLRYFNCGDTFKI